MRIKRCKTGIGPHCCGGSEEEKMKYISESFNRLYREGDFWLWEMVKSSVCA